LFLKIAGKNPTLSADEKLSAGIFEVTFLYEKGMITYAK